MTVIHREPLQNSPYEDEPREWIQHKADFVGHCGGYGHKKHRGGVSWRQVVDEVLHRVPSVWIQSRERQRGTSLMEVLVSILLLSLGLIGSTRLISGAIKEQSALRYRSVALVIAQGLAERMRANSLGITNGWYVDMDSANAATATPLKPPAKYLEAEKFVTNQLAVTDADCCGDEKKLAMWDVSNARLSLRAAFPGAALSLRTPTSTVSGVSASVPNARIIVIAWIEPILDVSTVGTSASGGSEVLLNDASNGCPAGFNDTTSPKENVRCLQYRFQL